MRLADMPLRIELVTLADVSPAQQLNHNDGTSECLE